MYLLSENNMSDCWHLELNSSMIHHFTKSTSSKWSTTCEWPFSKCSILAAYRVVKTDKTEWTVPAGNARCPGPQDQGGR